MNKYLLWLLAISLFLSEIILKFKPEFAFICYCFLIGGCLISLSLGDSLDNRGKLVIVFMILPILRISELFLQFNFIWNSFILYYLLLFLVVFYCIQFGFAPRFSSKFLFVLPIVLIFGGLVGVLGNMFFSFEKSIWFFSLLPIIAFSEELLFRGLIQNLTLREYGGVFSIFFTSLLYGIFSLGFGLEIAFFFFCVSLAVSFIYFLSEDFYLCFFVSLVLHLFFLVL